MKLKDLLKYKVDEKKLFKEGNDPLVDFNENLSEEQKKSFLETVGKFNNYNESIYREHDLKEISETIVKLGKLAEKYIMAEQDDWFDAISVRRDIKNLQDSIKVFESTAKEISVLQKRLEGVYEEVGTKFNKYFEIKDLNENKKSELRQTIKEDINEKQFLKAFERGLPSKLSIPYQKHSKKLIPYSDSDVYFDIGAKIGDMTREMQKFYDNLNTKYRDNILNDKLIKIYAKKYNMEW